MPTSRPPPKKRCVQVSQNHLSPFTCSDQVKIPCKQPARRGFPTECSRNSNSLAVAMATQTGQSKSRAGITRAPGDEATAKWLVGRSDHLPSLSRAQYVNHPARVLAAFPEAPRPSGATLSLAICTTQKKSLQNRPGGEKWLEVELFSFHSRGWLQRKLSQRDYSGLELFKYVRWWAAALNSESPSLPARPGSRESVYSQHKWMFVPKQPRCSWNMFTGMAGITMRRDNMAADDWNHVRIAKM